MKFPCGLQQFLQNICLTLVKLAALKCEYNCLILEPSVSESEPSFQKKQILREEDKIGHIGVCRISLFFVPFFLTKSMARS